MNDSPSDRGLKGVRVLVVEDEAPIALQLEDILVEAECVVVGPASRVAQALKLAEKNDVDVALLDLNIAGELVYPVADALERLGRPYIFATGYDGSNIAEPYRRKPILKKPFSRRQVLKAVLGAMEAT